MWLIEVLSLLPLWARLIALASVIAAVVGVAVALGFAFAAGVL